MVDLDQERLDSIFHALSDPTRRSILRDLASGEKTVGTLAEPYPMSLAAVSKHLKVLDEARLTARRRHGTFQVVSLNAANLQLAEEWLAYYQRFWTHQLDALQNFLEETPMETIAEQTKENLAVEQDLTLRFSRILKADRRRVFEAWTQPEMMRRWWAPGTMIATDVTNDLRVGGAYRIEMKGSLAAHEGTAEIDAASPIMAAHGVYREIVPYERLSYTWTGSWDPSEETLVTLTLRDVQGGTELILEHGAFLTERSRDGHQSGWESTLSKLANYLEA